MKEIYLAMDKDDRVYGYHDLPILHHTEWLPQNQKGSSGWLSTFDLIALGIDITKFPLTHEKPIKIRATWEVVE